MKPFRLNASILARRNGKFLLVRKPREHHAWQLPQGGVESGESFLEAGLREFQEEVGTDQIKILGERGVYFYDWPDNIEIDPRLEKFRGQEVHIFLADFLADDTAIQLDNAEVVEWKWVDRVELQDLIESPEYLAKILAILDAL